MVEKDKDFKHKIKKLIKYLLWEMDKKRSVKPAQLYKEITLRRYGRRYDLDCLIETGTYEGETIWGVKNNFKKIFTIELGSDLAKKAKEKFKNYPHVMTFEGDSEKKIKEIMPLIKIPSLFWLDAHYSRGKTARGKLDTPILNELKVILKHSKKHIILIDDFDSFGKGDYPTIKEISSFVEKDYFIRVKNDIIRLIPRRQ